VGDDASAYSGGRRPKWPGVWRGKRALSIETEKVGGYILKCRKGIRKAVGEGGGVVAGEGCKLTYFLKLWGLTTDEKG